MPPVGADQLLLTPRDIQLLFYPEYLGYTFRIIWENTEALRSFFRGFQSSRRIDTRTPKLTLMRERLTLKCDADRSFGNCTRGF